jgi:hypothetical protein
LEYGTKKIPEVIRDFSFYDPERINLFSGSGMEAVRYQDLLHQAERSDR